MEALLRHEGRWLRFRRPRRVLTARRVEDVLPLMEEAERSGRYVAGFLAYEASPAFDAALKVRDAGDFPLAVLGLFDAPESCASLDFLPAPDAFEFGALRPTVSREAYLAAIASVKERIAQGASYQVNYTYRLTAPFSGDARAFFRWLTEGRDPERAAFVETEDWSICSASPEWFFRLSPEGVATARPMKGTAARGRWPEEDARCAEALRRSKKDRAENVMIADMIRNDLGRVAEAGGVETESLFDVEPHADVWQMTSTVRARVGGPRAGRLVRLTKALFPCASITGAPKAKTMEIVAELESTPRRIYTGAIGFWTPEGEASFGVAIRTALIDRRAGRMEYGTGGGITWDSDPEAEWEETRLKTLTLRRPDSDFRLLETMLWEPDEGLFLVDEHLNRLARSAGFFGIAFDARAARSRLEATMAGLPPQAHRVRLLLGRAGGFDLRAFPLDLPASAAPVPAALARTPVDSRDRFLYHKTTRREVYDRARAERPDVEETILWNERGEVTEGTIANVVVRKNGRLVTPPVSSGLLPGTFRARLLETGKIVEEPVSILDLKSAREAFLINSVRRWRPLRLEA